MNPLISEIKYFGPSAADLIEIRIPETYPDPENLVLTIYDSSHNGSTTDIPNTSDVYSVTTDGVLQPGDFDAIPGDDDGILHYTFSLEQNAGAGIRLSVNDAVGLYNSVTNETFGLFSFGSAYTVSTASGDPFAGQSTTVLDITGQVIGTDTTNGTSLRLLQTGEYVAAPPNPGVTFLCFEAQTFIETPFGPRPVCDLKAGDCVITKDNGAKAIKWIGSCQFSDISMNDTVKLPILISADALGPGIPKRDTLLSPNHAVLMASWKASLYFAKPEVLVLAKALLKRPGVYTLHKTNVQYYHILLDYHDLILANGMWCESMFLGETGLRMIRPQDQDDIFKVFPGCRADISAFGAKIRPQLRVKETSLIV